MSVLEQGKFSDGEPLTQQQCADCKHPGLRHEYGMDGL